MKSDLNDFTPQWASKPGDTIIDILTKENLSKEEFAKKLGTSIDNITKLLNAEIKINPKWANLLSKALGGSKNFWLKRDLQYREALKRLDK